MFKKLVNVLMLLSISSYGRKPWDYDDEDIPYCDPDYWCALGPGNFNNSICLYGCKPSEGVGPIQPDYLWRKRLVYWHNYYRNQVAIGNVTDGGNGEASNMLAISYDLELEFAAACWIYHIGKQKHDVCRRTLRFIVAGQNLYGTDDDNLRTDEGVRLVVYKFFSQHNETESTDIDRFEFKRSKKWDRFSQLVWAETSHIGCARCSTTGNWYYVVACNYGPNGNTNNESFYQRGKPASECPDGLKPNSEFPGLCGEVEKFTPRMKKDGNPYWNRWMNISDPFWDDPPTDSTNTAFISSLYFLGFLFLVIYM